MACELCRLNRKSDKGVHFPFSDSKETLDDAVKRWNFKRAGEEAVKLLHELEPYPGGKNALRDIHDLDIQDKHQTLIPSAVSLFSPVIKAYDDAGNFAPQVVGSEDPTNVRLVFPAGSALHGQDLFPTLHRLVQTTASVIEAFKALGAPAG